MAAKQLRHGFTTGSSAAAAAKAALIYMSGRENLKEVEIPLPMGGRLTIHVECTEKVGEGVRATVIKDAGDDPDVTHHAKISCTVCLSPGTMESDITIEGGRGVGKVTRPGLSVPVGESAINPVPRRQIEEAIREGLEETGLEGAVSVVIEVENGEKIAQKTLNPRLGIVGGISILGTRGTVKPFSHEAYRDTISISMDVARAGGLNTVALSTGGRSEGFLKRECPVLPVASFIQVADFFSFSLEEAVKRGFRDILYACFFGKLVKMAQGNPYTHAKKSRVDFCQLSGWCASLGMAKEMVLKVAGANTVREVLGLILEDDRKFRVIADLIQKVLIAAREFAGPGPDITYYLFDFNGRLLVRQKSTGRG
ncbi:MAG: cobalt-precorrin-5B (C(1))-methyltransferase [Syntrophales bacterium]|nr:cobalt-precorrin-5B (C(1))-methyltransferase [Syntrophales bacterium]